MAAFSCPTQLRTQDHFRQMVNDSLRSPVKPSKWGQLGQSVRSVAPLILEKNGMGWRWVGVS